MAPDRHCDCSPGPHQRLNLSHHPPWPPRPLPDGNFPDLPIAARGAITTPGTRTNLACRIFPFYPLHLDTVARRLQHHLASLAQGKPRNVCRPWLTTCRRQPLPPSLDVVVPRRCAPRASSSRLPVSPPAPATWFPDRICQDDLDVGRHVRSGRPHLPILFSPSSSASTAPVVTIPNAGLSDASCLHVDFSWPRSHSDTVLTPTPLPRQNQRLWSHLPLHGDEPRIAGFGAAGARERARFHADRTPVPAHVVQNPRQ